MYSAVRRTISQMQQKEENQPVSMATVIEQIKLVVAEKADKSKIDAIVSEKANKVDTEMCLRWVDLLHKMVNKVVLLLTTKLKVDIDLGQETVNSRQNKKVQLLQQGLIISKWIESFDSQNINDFYFLTEQEKQPQRIQQVQLQFKRAIDDIEHQALSPNMVELNRQMKHAKDRLDLRQDDNKTQGAEPKRLRLGGHSQDRFGETLDADQMISDANGRYYSTTSRNVDVKVKFPPKMSPRS